MGAIAVIVLIRRREERDKAFLHGMTPVHVKEVENCALALASATEPSETGAVLQFARTPSKKVTVPVALRGETLTVNSTLWPHGTTVATGVTVMLDATVPIDWVSGADVLAR